MAGIASKMEPVLLSGLVKLFLQHSEKTTCNMSHVVYSFPSVVLPVCGVRVFIAVRIQERDDVPVHGSEYFITSDTKTTL
jgi:hypothetical protein